MSFEVNLPDEFVKLFEKIFNQKIHFLVSDEVRNVV